LTLLLLPLLPLLPLPMDFDLPGSLTDKTPKGRRAWVRRKKAKHCFAPPDGQAPCGDCPGLDREADEHVVFRRDRDVSSKNPGSAVDLERAARRVRRQGVLSFG